MQEKEGMNPEEKLEFETWLKTEYRPIRGGQGDGDDDGDPPPDDGGPDGGIPGDGGQQGQQHFKDFDGKPFETWNAIYGKYKTSNEQLKSYSEFGDANKVRADIQKLREWEKQVEQYQKGQQGQQNQVPPEKQKIIDELFALVPGLKQLSLLNKIPEFENKFNEYQESQTSAQLQASAEKAQGQLSKALAAAKIDPKYQDDIETLLWSKVGEEGQNAIRKGDATAAIELFKELDKTGYFAGQRMAKPSNPPLRNTPGGTPPKGQPQKITDMAQAGNAAWGIMNSE